MFTRLIYNVYISNSCYNLAESLANNSLCLKLYEQFIIVYRTFLNDIGGTVALLPTSGVMLAV